MGFFSHHHHWVELERFYAEPVDVTNFKRGPGELLQRLVMGVTTILYECSICLQTRKEEILGKSMKE